MNIAFLLFPGLTQLDLTGPAQFLSRLPGGHVDLVWKTKDAVMTDAGFAIVPTASFADVGKVDILCIPGGVGVADVMNDAQALDWVRTTGTSATWVTSVCTGSLILGAAGLLKGYQATTHWAWHDLLATFGAEPVKARTVFDRNRVTGGGVTAGIDFALALIAAISGETVARMIQLGLEYDPAPPFVGGSPETAGQTVVERYQTVMQASLDTRAEDIRAAARRLGFTDQSG